MAGFLFNMGADAAAKTTGLDAIKSAAQSGVYTTRETRPTEHGKWTPASQAVLADFLTMSAGDHVYFFSDRRIYGIGRLVSLGRTPALQNYPGAMEAVAPSSERLGKSLTVGDAGNRWLCTFVPSPVFFDRGVDMDFALASTTSLMRRLRANDNRTFIHLEDDEDASLATAILRVNRDYLDDLTTAPCLRAFDPANHQRISVRLREGDYEFDVTPVLESFKKNKRRVRLGSEMALEIAVVEALKMGDDVTTEVFGEWDYIAHQVPASPQKPFKYMDLMDVFCVRKARAGIVEGLAAPETRYAVIELKDEAAKPSVVSQVMSYVDWVAENHAGDDLSMVRAFVVASNFDDAVVEEARRHGRRFYSTGRREDSETKSWSYLSLVRYYYDPDAQAVRFHLEHDFSDSHQPA